MDNIPKIYAEWVKIFESLKNREDDEKNLELIKNGKIYWQTGVAERFLKRLVETVNFRLNKSRDEFQRAPKNDANLVVQSLIKMRKEFQFALKMVDINAIPEKEKEQLCQMVIDNSNQVQEALEKSAESDRTGKLLNIIKNTKVNIISSEREEQ